MHCFSDHIPADAAPKDPELQPDIGRTIDAWWSNKRTADHATQ